MPNKPLAVLLTDVHLTDNERENMAIIDVIKQIVQYCVKNNINKAFFGGDMFTDRPSQTLMTIRYYYEILQMFKDAKIQLFGIAGNHDKTDLNDTFSYMNMAFPYGDTALSVHFKLYETYGIVPVDNVLMCMMPFFEDMELLELILEKIKEETKASKCDKVLIMHQAINGVRNNDGEVVSNAISPKNLSYFKKIYVGHYHNRSTLTGNVFYFGSIRQANFGEDDEKGFCVLYDDLSHRFVNTKFKKFKHVKMDVNDIDEDFLDDMRKLSDGINLRITFKCSFDTKYKIPVNELIAMGIDVKTDNIELMVGLDSSLDESFDRMDKVKLISEWRIYSKSNKVPAKVAVEGIKNINTHIR